MDFGGEEDEDEDEDDDESDKDDEQEKKIKQTVAKMVGGSKSVPSKLTAGTKVEDDDDDESVIQSKFKPLAYYFFTG